MYLPSTDCASDGGVAAGRPSRPVTSSVATSSESKPRAAMSFIRHLYHVAAGSERGVGWDFGPILRPRGTPPDLPAATLSRFGFARLVFARRSRIGRIRGEAAGPNCLAAGRVAGCRVLPRRSARPRSNYRAKQVASPVAKSRGRRQESRQGLRAKHSRRRHSLIVGPGRRINPPGGLFRRQRLIARGLVRGLGAASGCTTRRAAAPHNVILATLADGAYAMSHALGTIDPTRMTPLPASS
jgi:hypothetical protein